MIYNRVLAAAAVCAAGFVSAAHAATFSFDVIAANDSTSGAITGGTTVGTGTITIDDTIPPTLIGTAGALTASQVIPGFPVQFDPHFDFSITAFGQTFDETNDSDALLGFDYTGATFDLTTFSLSISTTDATDPTTFVDPSILGFATATGNFVDISGTGSANNLGINVFINDVAVTPPIPLPASAVLLLSGLIGAGAVARRRAKS